MVGDKPLEEDETLSLGINKLVDSGPNFNYFIDLWKTIYRNAEFDIVKEVSVEWIKASQITKVVDKNGVTQGLIFLFHYVMKIVCAFKEIELFNSRQEWGWAQMRVDILKKTWEWSEGIKEVVRGLFK